ncbi:hypothetical protein [Rhizobium sp. BK661]|uniref:hypothetical protein n=1 Tax=Rhizobium sp. BK661 TaxID=2586991 RepID=UPI0021682B0F|nr:hypothetical protein [Rhizobium sp. BK661]MCS3742151.1 hypothetical protein [Rhizobium sp. BK661]
MVRPDNDARRVYLDRVRAFDNREQPVGAWKTFFGETKKSKELAKRLATHA